MTCRSFVHAPFYFFVAFAASIVLRPAAAQELPSSSLPNHLHKRIVADYGYWSKYQNPAYGHAQIPYRMLTHINHAGMSFNADGSLSVPDGFLEPELNNLAHANGVRVLLLLGGDFTGLETSGALDTLIDNIAAFAKEHRYDGSILRALRTGSSWWK